MVEHPPDVVTRAIAGFGLPEVPEPEQTEVPDRRWQELLSRVRRERITGLAVESGAAGWLTLTERQSSELLAAHRDAMVWCLKVERKLLALADAFDAEIIPFAVLKGPSVAHTVYADPCLRSFADLDLLVDSRDYERACRLLRRSRTCAPAARATARVRRSVRKGERSQASGRQDRGGPPSDARLGAVRAVDRREGIARPDGDVLPRRPAHRPAGRHGDPPEQSRCTHPSGRVRPSSFRSVTCFRSLRKAMSSGTSCGGGLGSGTSRPCSNMRSRRLRQRSTRRSRRRPRASSVSQLPTETRARFGHTRGAGRARGRHGDRDAQSHPRRPSESRIRESLAPPGSWVPEGPCGERRLRLPAAVAGADAVGEGMGRFASDQAGPLLHSIPRRHTATGGWRTSGGEAASPCDTDEEQDDHESQRRHAASPLHLRLGLCRLDGDRGGLAPRDVGEPPFAGQPRRVRDAHVDLASGNRTGLDQLPDRNGSRVSRHLRLPLHRSGGLPVDHHPWRAAATADPHEASR